MSRVSKRPVPQVAHPQDYQYWHLTVQYDADLPVHLSVTYGVTCCGVPYPWPRQDPAWSESWRNAARDQIEHGTAPLICRHLPAGTDWRLCESCAEAVHQRPTRPYAQPRPSALALDGLEFDDLLA